MDSSLKSLKQQLACSKDKSDSPGPNTLQAWFKALQLLQQATAGSDELFECAAKAVCEPGGLDGALILKLGVSKASLESKDFGIIARHIPLAGNEIDVREDLVHQAIDSRQTIFHDADSAEKPTALPTTDSHLHACVICPIQDKDQNVVAIIYGFRILHRHNNRRGIRMLEAQFVQVVADSIAAGLVRLESEAASARSQVLLEQAFTPTIARKLRSDSNALQGTTREVSVLFADLRGFSAISERIGAQPSFEMLSDVMDKFSDAINDHDGVIIDFYGDGISAFWNAPLDQPEHATLACITAFEMLGCMQEINEIWQPKIGHELKIGIGIHTGVARVGNSGSRTRLKYGPRGGTVNIASRLEAMTKQLGSPIVVSGTTAAQVADFFDSTRVVRSVLRGMTVPIDLCLPYAKSKMIKHEPMEIAYAQALTLFEAGELPGSLSILRRLRAESPQNRVVEFLLKVVSKQFIQSQESNEIDASMF